MFDVQLAAREVYKESKNFQAGDKAVIIETEAYNLGLSICYDLRFPELFRDLALNGAEIISVPAAFTVPTGKAHWHTLLRARAIETGCFILAAAQNGSHEDGRETYGHSLI
jgi:predicted amidohydrolase